MALKWTTTGAHAADHGIKLCVYGRAGAGKTTLIASAPRPIIASAESGTLSIARQNITLAEISNMGDLQEFYSWARANPDGRSGYDTICLDSWSEIGERLLTSEKAKHKDPRKAYGEMGDQLATMLRNFRDLAGWNVYFTAKAELRETPDGGRMWGPAMPGSKNAQGLAYYFDEFFYLGIGEQPAAVVGQPPTPYRFLQTQPDFQFDAKDRSGALLKIEAADLNYIFTKIRAHVAQTPPTPVQQ